MPDPLMRTRIRTDDPDVAHAWLRDAYADHTVRLSGRREAFRYLHETADLGPVEVSTAKHTMDLRSTCHPMGPTLLFAHLVSGGFRARNGSNDIDAAPGDLIGFDSDSSTELAWSNPVMAQIRIRRSAIERFAAGATGTDRDRVAVAWELGRPVLPERAEQWRRLTRYVRSEVVSDSAIRSSPLVMRQVQQLVMAAALTTFPNSTLSGLAVPPGHASPDVVRRAVAHIQEHAGEDLDLTAIAAAAHVGPRALQRAFRSALDVTPLQYLRSVRLDRAHEELVAADPADGTTVHAVALRWGFGHPGRFAADYRARFDRSPSDTLRG